MSNPWFPNLPVNATDQEVSAYQNWQYYGGSRPSFINDQGNYSAPSAQLSTTPSPTAAASGSSMAFAAAAPMLAQAGGNVTSSLITGLFGYANNNTNAGVQRQALENELKIAGWKNENARLGLKIQEGSLKVQQGQLELGKNTLGLETQKWQAEWDAARKVGLASPSQLGQNASFAFSRGTGSGLNPAARTVGRSALGY
jgi:hypothetical protein